MGNLRRSLGLALGLGLALALLSAPAAVLADDHARQKLAILPFEINDTSGEVGGSDHDAMLKRLTAVFDERIAKSGLYEVLARERVAEAVSAVNPGTYLRACNGCEIDIARRAGADRVLIGWIWKVSTLVGSLHIEIKDVATGRAVYARAFDFRGDTDEAWRRAAAYVVKTMEQRAAQSPGQ